VRIATAAEMAEIDRLAAAEFGLPVAVLMDAAGRRVASATAALLGGVAGRRVLLFCGRGNNGGDGLVAARLLHGEGASVRAVLAGSRDGLRPAAAGALAAAEAAGAEVLAAADPAALGAAAAGSWDLVVDALLGTGFAPPARGLAAEAIGLVNALGAPVIAVDVPSGLSADDGRIDGPAVKATATVTFGLAKPGLLLHPATRLVGRLWLADIGFPETLLERVPTRLRLATAGALRPHLAPRDPESHKGTFGHVLVAGGARGMAGAPLLAARGALRAGAGLVTVALPAAVGAPVLEGLPEAMTLLLPDSPEGALAPAAAAALAPALARAAALVVGPGLSRGAEPAAFVREVLAGLAAPAVVDADALAAFAGRPRELAGAPAPRVLTPHPGELARLLGVDLEAVREDRPAAARSCAEAAGAVVVLKGARTLVADPGGELWINPTGCPAMATAGMGDVLAGMIAAHLARGMHPVAAAVLGAHLHGLAGELVAAGHGPWGILASEVADSVPEAVRRVAAGEDGEAEGPDGCALLLP